MKKSPWKLVDSLPEYTQLLLFPPTEIEVLTIRVKQFEAEIKEKLDRQRKSQFAKIGALQKCVDELKQDMDIIKHGLCQQNKNCDIVELQWAK